MTTEPTTQQKDTPMTNLALWDRVCTTNPEMTSRVTQRGGFTSIDSYYTIKRLTEQFGPLGTGWGWDAAFDFRDGLVVCTASFWYMAGPHRSSPTPLVTMNPYLSHGKDGKAMVDDDAAKKALTDAITKWASYLGFSADVFEGKFDDSKYVEGLKKQFAPVAAPKAAAPAKQQAPAPQAKPEQPKPQPVFNGEAQLITFQTQVRRDFGQAQTVADLETLEPVMNLSAFGGRL